MVTRLAGVSFAKENTPKSDWCGRPYVPLSRSVPVTMRHRLYVPVSVCPRFYVSQGRGQIRVRLGLS